MQQAVQFKELRRYQDVLSDRAKRYWIVSLVLSLVAITVTFIGNFLPVWLYKIAVLTFLLLVMGEISLLLRDRTRAIVEALKRRSDLSDSFGFEIDAAYISAIRADNISIAPTPEQIQATSSYFASTSRFGVIRGLENLRESTWWSARQALNVSRYVLVLIVALILGFVLAMYFLAPLQGADTRLLLARGILTLVLSVFTGGLVRLYIGYLGLHRSASVVFEKAVGLLESRPDETVLPGTMILWSEYHVARALGPLLPSRHYHRVRDQYSRIYKGTFLGEDSPPAN